MSERDGEAIGLDALFCDADVLIARARARITVTTNAETLMLYWRIGVRIREELSRGEGVDSIGGADALERLAGRLAEHPEADFEPCTLMSMVEFVEAYPDPDVFLPLAGHLNWDTINELLAIADGGQRDFYFTQCAERGWSAAELREQVDGRLYHRTVTPAADSGR